MENNRARHGGGVYNCVLVDSVVCSSRAEYGGGAEKSDLVRCRILHNRADHNGGAALDAGLYDCLVARNSAGAYGGSLDYGTAVDCTFVDNTASNAGGGVYAGSVTNCIIYYNAAATSSNYDDSSRLRYTCSALAAMRRQHGWGAGFRDRGSGDYHLGYSSTCIAAGTTDTTSDTDLDSRIRLRDGDADGVGMADLGCYEYQPEQDDTDGDGTPDGWGQRYGLNPLNGTDGSDDPDSDRVSNYQEYVADTDHRDSASRLFITGRYKAASFEVSLLF